MTIKQWPPGTFSWLAQVFDAAAYAKLVNEGQALIELIVTVAPHFRDRKLLEGMLLHHTARYHEAAQALAEHLSAHPSDVVARYVLYQSLWAIDDREWFEHAQRVATSGDVELGPLAREKLAEAGQASAGDEPVTTAEPVLPTFHNMLVRV
jgi:Bacterial type III secretion protein (HrpB1_HrpK)